MATQHVAYDDDLGEGLDPRSDIVAATLFGRGVIGRPVGERERTLSNVPVLDEGHINVRVGLSCSSLSSEEIDEARPLVLVEGGAFPPSATTSRLLPSELGFVFPPLPDLSPNLAVLTNRFVDISPLQERANLDNL